MNPDLRPLSDAPPSPIVNARLVRDYTYGRQWGVDSARFGKPYVFARTAPDGLWMIWAGPFETEDAAERWIAKL